MVFTAPCTTRSQKRTLNLQQAGTIPAKGERPRAPYCGCPARGSRDPLLINTNGKFGGRSNKPSSQIAASFDSELPVKPNIEDFMVIGVLRSFLIIGITTRTTKFKQTEAEGWKQIYRRKTRSYFLCFNLARKKYFHFNYVKTSCSFSYRNKGKH